MRAAARFRPRRPRGFTLVESLVALSIALLLVLTGYAMYRGATGSYRRAEDERRFLAAIRSATDGLSRDLQSIVAKAAYRPDGVFKPLDGGMLRLQWPHAPGAFNHLESDEPRYAAFQDGRCRYLGFYVSGDRKGAERVEYYFNPGEPPELRFNGMDDDGDEPAGGTGFLIDEAGALMVRRAREDDLDYPAYAEAFPPVPPALRHGAPGLTGKPGNAGGEPGGDDGLVLADGFSDVSFAFVYARRADPGDPASPAAKRLFVARAWPWDEPGDLETPGEASWAEDLTGERWPRSDAEGGRPKGLSYLSLPLAVVIRFEFPRNGAARAVEHTVRLPSSGWYDLMTRR